MSNSESKGVITKSQRNTRHYIAPLIPIILLLGMVLRMLTITQMEWTHDELSALNRTHYESFEELISEGVEVDFHPAGVQTFLWQWVKVSDSKLWVKLPFVLLSCISLWWFYLWVMRMSTPEHGALALMIMSVSEYFVFYGQLARPYGPGLFFAVLTVLCLQRITDRKLENKGHWAGYAIGMLGLSYTHYYAQFFALIVFVLAWFYLPKKSRIKFLGVNVLVLLLYSPHIPLFFRTFTKGGVGGEDGWLGPPDSHFLSDFFQLQFNYSSIGIAIGGALLLWGLFRFRKLKALYVLPFVISLGIGWYYSIAVNPILQFSILIFSLPFFIGTLIAALPKGRYLWVVTGLLCLSGLYSLIESRKYYELTTQNGYSKGVELSEMYGNLISSEDPQNWYRHGVTRSHLRVSIPEAYSTERNGPLYWVVDRPLQKDVQSMMRTHPYVIERHKSFAHDFWVFSTIPPDEGYSNGLVEREFLDENAFESSQWAWNTLVPWAANQSGFVETVIGLEGDSLPNYSLIPYSKVEVQGSTEEIWAGTALEVDSNEYRLAFFPPANRRKAVDAQFFIENPYKLSGYVLKSSKYSWFVNGYYDGVLRPVDTERPMSDFALTVP